MPPSMFVESLKQAERKESMTDAAAVRFRICTSNMLEVGQDKYTSMCGVTVLGVIYFAVIGRSIGFLQLNQKNVARKPILAARFVAASTIKYPLGFVAGQVACHGTWCSFSAVRNVDDDVNRAAAGSALGFVNALCITRSPLILAGSTAGCGAMLVLMKGNWVTSMIVNKLYGPFK